MIDVIITSYNEPKATLRAVKTFLAQKKKYNMRIIVVDPFPEVGEFLKKNVKDKSVEFFLDPGEGKSYALNMLFQEYDEGNKDDIFVLTDGDVHVSENALDEISQAFEKPEVGCVTAKPVSIDSRGTKYGYWSHFVFDGIHNARQRLNSKNKFFECSGYLFAIRKGVLFEFPLEACEDGIISYLFWKEGYKISYLPQVEVYVKNPDNWNDWLIQKVRNVKGHENYSKLFPEMPRTKSLFNEIKNGWYYFFVFPKNPKEILWTTQLYFARLYLYFRAFREIKNKKTYKDGWRENETPSTRTLD